MAKQKKLSPELRAWVDARKRFHLSDAHVQMARELGMNPKKLGGMANHRHEPWKLPLPLYIQELYAKRFKKGRPDSVCSIERMAADKERKQAERKEHRHQRREAAHRENPIQPSVLSNPEDAANDGTAGGGSQSIRGCRTWRQQAMPKDTIEINRAPVLTLWATIVAERLGFSPEEALSLGKAVAGLNAQAKGRALGIFEAKREAVREAKQRKRGEEFWVKLCGRPVPAKNTDQGIRAVSGDRPIDSDSAARYLSQKFGDDLASVKEAMEALAKAFEPDDLAERAFALYEAFRPDIPRGKTGWGAKATLDLRLIRSLAPGK